MSFICLFLAAALRLSLAVARGLPIAVVSPDVAHGLQDPKAQ